MLASGPFKVDISSNGVTLVRDGKLSFSPAEGDPLRKLVGMVLSMSSFKVLPPYLKSSPFEVAFSEEGSCTLSRKDRLGEGIVFSFSEGDSLIKAIDLGTSKHSDELRIRGGPRAGVSSYDPPEPIIEGR